MEDTAQVTVGYQSRQIGFHRTPNLIAACAQLGLDEGQSQCFIDALLGPSSDDCAAATQALAIEREAFVACERAELVDVFFGAGCKKQGSSIVAAVHEVDLHLAD